MDVRYIVVVNMPEPNHLDPSQTLNLSGSSNKRFAGHPLTVSGQYVPVGTRVEGIDVSRKAKVSCHTFLLSLK
jgi:hypothetical protein